MQLYQKQQDFDLSQIQLGFAFNLEVEETCSSL